ncbi:hypothetical protein GCM10025787_42380 [Saccharopolyspora rosea]
MFAAVLAVVLVVGSACSAAPPDPRVARTPPMGWNSWNSFGCGIDERLIRDTADHLVSSGMRDAGYRYLVVDDCWFDPRRDAGGELRADPVRFPSGMRALADYVHSRGLEFGLYEVPTDRTCAQRSGTYPGATGSRGHEEQDARTFADWGVDYLKYDWCSPEGTLDEQIDAFSTMRNALRATGRPIVFSINPNSDHAAKTGATHDWTGIAHQWRTTDDIKPVWHTDGADEMGVVDVVDVNRKAARRAGPGHWHDPDMLEVGVHDVDGFRGLNGSEARAHLSTWAVMAAPLLAGNNVTTMPAEVRDALTNPEVIAVDQDPAGIEGTPVRATGDQQVWAKPMADGSRVVALFNRGDRPATIRTTAGEAGLPRASACTVRDLWAHATTTTSGDIAAVVPAHGVALLRVSAR